MVTPDTNRAKEGWVDGWEQGGQARRNKAERYLPETDIGKTEEINYLGALLVPVTPKKKKSW